MLQILQVLFYQWHKIKNENGPPSLGLPPFEIVPFVLRRRLDYTIWTTPPPQFGLTMSGLTPFGLTPIGLGLTQFRLPPFGLP